MRMITFILFIISEFKFVTLIAVLRDMILTFAFYGKYDFWIILYFFLMRSILIL